MSVAWLQLYCMVLVVQSFGLACTSHFYWRVITVARGMQVVYHEHVGPASPLQPPLQQEPDTVAQPVTVHTYVSGNKVVPVASSRPSTAASAVQAAYYMQVQLFLQSTTITT